jgi:N6-adenosine-specific RNA methylase IME4
MSDIGELARAIVEAKRRASLSPDELFDLQEREDNENYWLNIHAEAERAALAASTGVTTGVTRQ